MLSTWISRLSDSMVLVSTLDYDEVSSSDETKRTANKILKTLKVGSPPRCSINSPSTIYHYIIEGGVVYLTATERDFSRISAFNYLSEVAKSFSSQFGLRVSQFLRPYAAVEFEPQMNRIRKNFKLNANGQSNNNGNSSYSSIHTELSSIHNIMNQNINELLHRGEKLDHMEQKSHQLINESKKFDRMGKYLNLQAMYRTYGPIVAIVIVCLFIVYYRFF